MRLWPLLVVGLAACSPLPELGSALGAPGQTPPLLPAAELDALDVGATRPEDADLLNARADALRTRAAELAAGTKAKRGVAPALRDR